MCSDSYDYGDEAFEDSGRQQLEEYEMYVHEQNAKARALLTVSSALILGCSVADDLATLVRRHASQDGGTTLGDVLRDTVAEEVIAQAINPEALRQAVTREGFVAIRKMLDGACRAFEDLLAAQASR